MANGTGLDAGCDVSVSLVGDRFEGNHTGVKWGEYAEFAECAPGTIASSVFTSNSLGMSVQVNDALQVTDSTFQGNEEAMQLDVFGPASDASAGSFSMRHSNVLGNGKGMEVTLHSQQAPVPSLEQNNFGDNQSFAVRTTDAVGLSPGLVIDATNNWWGTTDRSVIQHQISDCSDPTNTDSQQLCVKIDPYLRSPDPEASAALASLVTATPTAVPPTVPPPTPTLPPPTPTSLPTATSTPVSFSVDAVKVEPAHAAPDYSLARPSLKIAALKRRVRLSVYFRMQFPAGTLFVTDFRVTSGGRTVFFKRTHHGVGSGHGGEQRYGVSYVPTRRGRFTFEGLLSVAGDHRQRTVSFAVR